MPCTPARARMLLRGRKAAVLRRYPFTIILKARTEGDLQPIELKADPGSKVTGVALVADYAKRGKTVVWAMDLRHRGQAIKDALVCRMDRFGFPRTSGKAAREVKGFRTGDMVQSVVPSGKKAGTHIGKVAVRASGSFNVSTTVGVVQGISHKHCSVLHRADGYSYLLKTGAPLGFEKPSIRAQEVS